MYREDWAIADTASLGSDFTLLSGTNQRIVSQVAEGNASGTTAGFYKYTVGKMPSDNVRIDFGILTPPNGTLSSSVSLGVMCRMPDTFATTGAAGTEMIFEFLNTGTWAIDSLVQTTFTSQVSASLAGGFSSGDVVTILAVGTQYSILRNGIPIPSAIWTDASNSVVSVGATKRNWGVLVQCVATNLQAYGIDWIVATDLSGQFFGA